MTHLACKEVTCDAKHGLHDTACMWRCYVHDMTWSTWHALHANKWLASHDMDYMIHFTCVWRCDLHYIRWITDYMTYAACEDVTSRMTHVTCEDVTCTAWHRAAWRSRWQGMCCEHDIYCDTRYLDARRTFLGVRLYFPGNPHILGYQLTIACKVRLA